MQITMFPTNSRASNKHLGSGPAFFYLYMYTFLSWGRVEGIHRLEEYVCAKGTGSGVDCG